MSVSSVNTDASVLYQIYQKNTSPPPEPFDFSRFAPAKKSPSTGGQSDSLTGDKTSSGSPAARLKSDLSSLLLGLQAGHSAATTTEAGTSTGSSGTASSGKAAGTQSPDLASFLKDLASVGGSHGHGRRDAEAVVQVPGTPPATGATSTPVPSNGAAETGEPKDLLAYIAKALQSYAPATTGLPTVALSA